MSHSNGEVKSEEKRVKSLSSYSSYYTSCNEYEESGESGERFLKGFSRTNPTSLCTLFPVCAPESAFYHFTIILSFSSLSSPTGRGAGGEGANRARWAYHNAATYTSPALWALSPLWALCPPPLWALHDVAPSGLSLWLCSLPESETPVENATGADRHGKKQHTFTAYVGSDGSGG
jgi:hypothetical protein